LTVVVPAACAYELDRKRRIVALDEAWSRFATANGAPELAAPRPLGTPLFAYIRDSVTKHLYEQIFNRVTLTGGPATVPLRCDSPSLRRHLELHVSPLAAGGLRLYTTVVREEPRQGVPLLDQAAEHSADEFVRMCSWCKRVEHESAWFEAEEVVNVLRLFERDVMPSITHGICPSCEALVTAGLS
jgi:hypothetical protein